MRPKFAIGEDVIVVSSNYSHANGGYVIEEILSPKEACIRSTGNESKQHLFKSNFYYVLDGLQIVDKNVLTICYDFMSEGCLRKKHKPSDMSFTDLMTSIKSNATA